MDGLIKPLIDVAITVMGRVRTLLLTALPGVDYERAKAALSLSNRTTEPILRRCRWVELKTGDAEHDGVATEPANHVNSPTTYYHQTAAAALTRRCHHLHHQHHDPTQPAPACLPRFAMPVVAGISGHDDDCDPFRLADQWWGGCARVPRAAT